MRRTNNELQTAAVLNTDCSQVVRRTRRILTAVVLVFVLAGVSGITGFMCVLMPQQYAQIINEQYASLRTADAGDSIFLGKYEQDNDPSDGAEPIEWLVLAKEENRLLLVSRYALDYVPFNTYSRTGTWGNSSIQCWLNESFYTTAFSNVEQSIVRLTVSDGAAKSRVFLLSVDEIQKYFRTSNDCKCKPTRYAASKGAGTEYGTCGWWLRSPGYYVSSFTRVLPEGAVSQVGQPATRLNAVRPAMWIEVKEAETGAV